MQKLLDKLLEDKDFEDIFQPLSDEEAKDKGLTFLKSVHLFVNDLKEEYKSILYNNEAYFLYPYNECRLWSLKVCMHVILESPDEIPESIKMDLRSLAKEHNLEICSGFQHLPQFTYGLHSFNVREK